MLYQARNAILQQSSTDSLLELARGGDSDAFGELMKRHHGIVRRTAYSFLRNHEDADDVVQDVSISVLRKLHTFEGNAAFSTWLTRIAINASLARIRQTRRRPIYSLEELTSGDEAAFFPIADHKPSPEQQCACNEMKHRLSQAVSKLPDTLRNVANDHLYDELSMVEVAGKRGLTLAATKSRAHRARKRLILMLS